jgi:hypothetical protein
MPLKEITELKIFAQNVKALMPAEAFEIGGMDAPLDAGGERPWF